MISLPDFLTPAIDALHSRGATPVIVGGYIRDTLLGIPCKDIDIEVYDIDNYDEIVETLMLFGDLNLVGKSFGVLKLSINGYVIDFTLPRLESKVAKGHKGFDITLNTNISYEEAAKRRDFTINSIGYEIKSDTVLDPFNGILDLKAKRLTYIDEKTFQEDPLRVFRAVGFCARFELECSPSLIRLCRHMVDKGMMDELPSERIFEEFNKLFSKANKPSLGFALFESFHLYTLFPELLHVKNFNHLDNLAAMKTGDSKNDMVLMLSILVFDFDSLKEIEIFLHKLTNEKRIIEEVTNLYTHKHLPAKILSQPFTNYDVFILSTKVNIKHLLLILEAKGENYKELKEKAIALNIFTCEPEPLLKGRDLIEYGLTPSPIFSDILNAVYDAQLKELFTTYEDAQLWLQEYLKHFKLYQ